MENRANYLFIVRTFHLLARHRPGKLVLIFILTLIQGVNSGFSIMLLVPMLQLLNIGSPGQPAEGVGAFFSSLPERTGISITIETILIIYVVLLATGGLLQYWKSLLDAKYQQTFIFQLRSRLFRKILLADWPTLNSKSKTSHLQILTREVPNMAVYYHYYLRLATALIMTLSYTAWAMLVSPAFTMVIVVAGVVLFIILRKYLFKAFHLGSSFVDSYNRLYKYIDDFWQSVKIAKVHSSEEFYYDKFDEANNSLLTMEYRMQKNYALPQLIYRMAGIFVLVLVVYSGYRTGTIPLASLFILILLFSRIFPRFVEITEDINMLLSNAASARLVLQLDDEFPESKFNEHPEGSIKPPGKEIKLENIYFAYPDGEVIFKDFSATIKARSVTGIIGGSGRGKTTLIDLIAGLQKPDGGRLTSDGNELGADLLPSWKAGIGYLPQDPFFIDGTIRENLIWDSSTDISDDEIWRVLEQVNAVHLVTRYKGGLDTMVVNYSFAYSGGECQRLALARVLLRKPVLLLLDEATSSLDGENEAIIMESLKKLKSNVTIVFVTHRASLLPWFDSIINI